MYHAQIGHTCRGGDIHSAKNASGEDSSNCPLSPQGLQRFCSLAILLPLPADLLLHVDDRVRALLDGAVHAFEGGTVPQEERALHRMTPIDR